MQRMVEIIYQNSDIVAINKPAGISVTKDRSGTEGLQAILEKQLPTGQAAQLRLVHRLDKHTSGVMILAKNRATQSQLSSDFEKKLIKKTYLALVTGVVTEPEGSIDAALARSRKNPQLMSIARKAGKPAGTKWKLLADFGTVSLLAVFPLTGRTHQIRVHLQSIGLPLAIDPLYGGTRPLLLSDFKMNYRLSKGQTEKPLIDRLTLHAYQLSLTNPLPNCLPSFIAALDKKFTAAVKMLTKHNPKGPEAFLNPEDFSNIINAQSLY